MPRLAARPTRPTPVLPPITVGLQFSALRADGVCRYRVTRPAGPGAWWGRALETDEDPGHERPFSTAEIQRALAHARWTATSGDEQAAFWATQSVGTTLHYHHGFGAFVRGTVVVLPDGGHGLRPEALVGAWQPWDLPRRLADGRLDEGYHAPRIRAGTAWQPHVSTIVEAGARVPAQAGDPRAMPPLPLTVPDLSPAEAQRAHLCRETRALAERLLAASTTDAIGPALHAAQTTLATLVALATP